MGSSFKDAVEEINSTFAKAYNNKDAAGCAATYADDARIVYSDGKMMKGRKALAAALKNTFKTDSKFGKYEIIRAVADGNVGYSVQKVTLSEGSCYVVSGYTRAASGKWLTDDEVASSLST